MLLSKLVYGGLAGALFAVVTLSPASAVSVDVAKKCRELMVKAYPPVRAGTSKGNTKEQQEYFRTCIARGGNMEQKNDVSLNPKSSIQWPIIGAIEPKKFLLLVKYATGMGDCCALAIVAVSLDCTPELWEWS